MYSLFAKNIRKHRGHTAVHDTCNSYIMALKDTYYMPSYFFVCVF